MSRARGRVAAHRRHKKMLARARGHKGQRHRLFRRASESVVHALDYSYRDRRDRKGQFRRLWITRINAAARAHGMSYGHLIDGLHKAGVEVNRKILADLAVRDPNAFASLAATAKGALGTS